MFGFFAALGGIPGVGVDCRMSSIEQEKRKKCAKLQLKYKVYKKFTIFNKYFLCTKKLL